MTRIVFLRPKMKIPEPMPYPHLGIGYMASILKKNGHDVHYIDCAIRDDSYSAIVSEVEKLNPDAVGITAKSAYYFEMKKLSKKLHRLKIPIILGGVHPTILPELSLRECEADFAVLGEGELTILELMNLWEDKSKRKQINGIAYLENNQFIRNPERELIEDLDILPFPDWDLINPENYPAKYYLFKVKRLPVGGIMTTRGCPHICSFCASTNFWKNTVRKRSAQNVVDEIEFLANEYGIKEIQIADDYFNVTKKHVIDICKEILKRKLDLTFSCPNGLRIETMDRELLSIMRKAGFYSFSVAFESGTQSILNRIHKKLNLKLIRKKMELAKSFGFFLMGYFMFGLPGETYETARRTIQTLKSLPYDTIGCFFAVPLPGSNWWYEWCKDRELSEIDYTQFHYIEFKNKLKYTDGNRTVTIPLDVFREFYLRPIQLIRYLKYWVNTFHLSQSLVSPFRRFYTQIFDILHKD